MWCKECHKPGLPSLISCKNAGFTTKVLSDVIVTITGKASMCDYDLTRTLNVTRLDIKSQAISIAIEIIA